MFEVRRSSELWRPCLALSEHEVDVLALLLSSFQEEPLAGPGFAQSSALEVQTWQAWGQWDPSALVQQLVESCQLTPVVWQALCWQHSSADVWGWKGGYC